MVGARFARARARATPGCGDIDCLHLPIFLMANFKLYLPPFILCMYVNITDMNDVYEKMREREKKVVSDAQIPEYR
jgi:hypothetical protein